MKNPICPNCKKAIVIDEDRCRRYRFVGKHVDNCCPYKMTSYQITRFAVIEDFKKFFREVKDKRGKTVSI